MKSDIKAIVNGIDLVMGGVISQLKTNIANTYKGYLEEKLNELIQLTIKNGIEDKSLQHFIDNITDTEKDLLYYIIKKSLDSKDKIKIYIMAIILSNQIKNKSLNYYEDSLISNIDLLTENDFKNYPILVNNMNYRDNAYYEISVPNNEEQISLIKFLNIGILIEYKETITAGNSIFNLLKTPYSDDFYNLINGYYKEKEV